MERTSIHRLTVDSSNMSLERSYAETFQHAPRHVGHYVFANVHDIIYPPVDLPVRNSRPVAGLYAFIPDGGFLDHHGLRFRDHAPCFRKKRSILLYGDSHARVLYDILLHRLQGNDSIAEESPKMTRPGETKQAKIGNLSLVGPLPLACNGKADSSPLDRLLSGN